MYAYLYIFRNLLMVIVLAGLAACTGKAQSLKVAAAQFGASSITAIEAMEAMNRERIAPPERSEAQAGEQFVNDVLSLPSGQRLSSSDILTLADPLVVNTPNFDKQMNAFLSRMRTSYQAFAAIFDNIEAASFTATRKVKAALPLARKLTIQLVYFSKVLEERPLDFIVQRNALVAELNKMRENWDSAAPKPSTQAQRSAVFAWFEKWQALQKREKVTKEAVIRRLTAAASIGLDMSEQIANYDQLSLDDITESLARALGFAEALTGRDLASVRAKADQIVAKIRSDPAWAATVNLALKELSEFNVGNSFNLLPGS